MHLIVDLDAAVARSDQHIFTFASVEEIHSLYGISFPRPPIIQGTNDAWWIDEEFAHQRIFGLKPLMIEQVKAFLLVSLLDPQFYGTSYIRHHSQWSSRGC